MTLTAMTATAHNVTTQKWIAIAIRRRGGSTLYASTPENPSRSAFAELTATRLRVSVFIVIILSRDSHCEDATDDRKEYRIHRIVALVVRKHYSENEVGEPHDA
jgi:hypothetical protein